MKKKHLLITLLVFLSYCSFGQKPKEVRYFKEPTKLSKCNVEGTPIKNGAEEVKLDVEDGWQFTYSDLPNGMKRK